MPAKLKFEHDLLQGSTESLFHDIMDDVVAELALDFRNAAGEARAAAAGGEVYIWPFVTGLSITNFIALYLGDKRWALANNAPYAVYVDDRERERTGKGYVEAHWFDNSESIINRALALNPGRQND